MKYAFAIVYLLLFCGWILPAMAQDKPKPPASTTSTTPPAAATPTTTAPASAASVPVSPARALAIRDAQVKALSLRSQMQQADLELQAAVRAAYAEAKLNENEYNIDDRTWVFVPAPKAPVSAPASAQPTAQAAPPSAPAQPTVSKKK